MHDVLVYVSDPDASGEVEALFSEGWYRLQLVDQLSGVMEICQQELIDLIVVWNPTPDEVRELHGQLYEQGFGYIPLVAVVPDDADWGLFADLPLAELIQMSLPRAEFFHLLYQVLLDVDVQASTVEGTNWQGSLEEYNLIDLIQMVEHSHRDAELVLSWGERVGKVFFHEGKIINAQFELLQGMPALYRLALWSRGQFMTRLSTWQSLNDEIGLSNQEILMSLVEKLLKIGQISRGLPDLMEPILRNPYAELTELTPLQHKIVNYCEAVTTIFDLLMTLSDDLEEVMLEMKGLFRMGVLGRKEDVERRIQEEKQKSGLGKLVSSISSVFRKKPASQSLLPEDDFVPEDQLPPAQPRVKIPPLQLDENTLQRIHHRIEALGR
ncbi:MAG: DUF4388 domain-containing protein [Calditrichaeota bacterium]|nr:MAG: DUF4388 domain-containing protein [Calditrichota bacterium]